MIKNNNIKLLVIITFIGGVLLGYYAYDKFNNSNVIVKTETVTEYVPYQVVIHDTIEIEIPIKQYIKDTVIKEIPYPLNNYSGSQATKYGNLLYSAKTAGELVGLTITPDFNFEELIPHTTTTVTKQKSPRGIYLGASITNTLVPSVGVSYLDKDWLFNYNYTISNSVHQLGISKRIF